jgi:hypothetical protein
VYTPTATRFAAVDYPTREYAGGLAILAIERLLIEKEAQAAMTSTPFQIQWIIPFLIPGNFTLSGVRNLKTLEPRARNVPQSVLMSVNPSK